MFIDNQNITILSELLFVHSSIIRTFVSDVIFQLETRDKWQLSPRVGFWWSVVYLAIYSEEPSDSYYWSSAQSAVTFKYSIFFPIAHIRASTAAASVVAILIHFWHRFFAGELLCIQRLYSAISTITNTTSGRAGRFTERNPAESSKIIRRGCLVSQPVAKPFFPGYHEIINSKGGTFKNPLLMVGMWYSMRTCMIYGTTIQTILNIF